MESIDTHLNKIRYSPNQLMQVKRKPDFVCRSCNATGLRQIISFGRTPLADRLLTQTELSQPELHVPLELVFCPTCTLVQITEDIDPEIIFNENFPYFSSVSPALLEHSQKNALALIQSEKLNWWKWQKFASLFLHMLLPHFIRPCSITGLFMWV